MGLGEIILGEMGLGEMGLGEMGQNHDRHTQKPEMHMFWR